MEIKLFAMLLSLCMVSCRQGVQEQKTSEPMRVKVTRIEKEMISFPVLAGGIVVSSREMMLSFKTGGIIASIHVEEGDKVTGGTVLASLNLSEMNAQYSQAKDGFEKALRDYTRVKNLYADSVATLEQLENSETAKNVARAVLDIAEFNLKHSTITATDDGTILKRLAQENEVIAPGYPVFIFGTTGSWKIRAGLSDRDFVRIRPGDPAKVTFDAYPDTAFAALVSQVGESANPMTGTYTVELDLLQVPERLASGFVANVAIVPDRKQAYIMVPIGAVVEAEGQTGAVFTVNAAGRAQKLHIGIAAVRGDHIAVSKGLDTIAGIVTEGAAFLSAGDSVEIVYE
jgi:RND family efflux transporter MFP subunit